MSRRSKGLNKERSLAAIYQELGYKVQRAIPSVRFIGKGKFVSHSADLFGCIDVMALRRGNAPVLAQCSDIHNRSIKKKDLEKEIAPYLHLGIMGDVRLLLFSWGRTKKNGYAWSVEELWETYGWVKLGLLRLNGSFEPAKGSLSIMFSPLPTNGGDKK